MHLTLLTEERGCAENADGTLKDAKDIDFDYDPDSAVKSPEGSSFARSSACPLPSC